MFRYRFAVEYLGTDFAGWQVQPGQLTVQGELEKALEICLRAPTGVTGAGRTDAGVHGRGQVAHFDSVVELDARKVEKSVNALTPDSIFIRRLERCEEGFHARYGALTRLYHYRIALRPTALSGATSWYPGFPMDAEKFARELARVIGEHDFVNFSVPREDGKSTLCEVVKAELRREEGFLIAVIEANRFLHKMVRSMVGAAFDVSRGAWPEGLVDKIFAGSFTGERTWAPPTGLCLEKVTYADYEY